MPIIYTNDRKLVLSGDPTPRNERLCTPGNFFKLNKRSRVLVQRGLLGANRALVSVDRT
ncbi:hypothetical protein M6B38_182215 [Iris pallida]|uniref:Uncharacterized protein n=1 Tax=Iris pallida TaxID=29817 RepID=A0AAX6EMI7_IRIPA|nr:hypothetical protein M6B38_182215 [Iris pallida]